MLDLHDISEREYYGSRVLWQRHVNDPDSLIFYYSYYAGALKNSWRAYESEKPWHINYLHAKNRKQSQTCLPDPAM